MKKSQTTNTWLASLGLYLGILIPGVVSSADAEPLQVLGSVDTRGQIEKSQLADRPFGGVAHRAHLVEEVRGAGPLLLVDGGNLLMGSDFPEGSEALVGEAYRLMGYDVINLSQRDLRGGKSAVLSLMETYELPFLSANLQGRDGELLFPPYRVIEKGGHRVGVLGVTAKPLEGRGTSDEEWQVGDPRAALERYLPELGAEAEVILVAWHGEPVWGLRQMQPFREQIHGVLLAGADHLPELPGWTLLAPADRGREWARAEWVGGRLERREPLWVETDGEQLESLAKAVQEVREEWQEKRSQAAGPRPLPEALPVAGETFVTMRRARHQGLGLTVLAWGVEERSGEDDLVVLEVSIRNQMAPRLVSGLGFAEAVQVATLNNKAFLVADNRLVLRHEQVSGLEGQLPDRFRILQPGRAGEGKLAFRLPPGDWKSLDLVLLHDEFPPLEIPLLRAGEEGSVPESLVTAGNDVLEMSVFSWGVEERWRGQNPPSGKKWVVAEVRGISRMSRMAESAALDATIPTSENEKVEHLVPMEYFYFPDTVVLELPGQRFIPWDRELSEFGDVPVFLPHRSTGGTLVFAVPEDLTDESLALRTWFPSMALVGEGGQALRMPSALRFPLQEGEGRVPEELAEPLASLADSPLRLDILKAERTGSFGEEDLPQGKEVLALTLRLLNQSGEAGLLPLEERFGVFVGQERFSLDFRLTQKGPFPPTKNLYLPPGEARVLTVAIPFPEGTTKLLFDYRGVTTNQRVQIDLGGAHAVVSPEPERTATRPEEADGWQRAQVVGPETEEEEEEAWPLALESLLGKERYVPPAVYTPHEGGQPGVEEDDFLRWDARDPLQVTIPEGRSSVRVRMDLPDEWWESLWDLDLRMSELEGSSRRSAASLRFFRITEDGDRETLWLKRFAEAQRFYGFAAPEGFLYLEISGESRGNPEWEASLAVVNRRPRGEDWVHHPADRRTSAFFAGEESYRVRGEFIGQDAQFLRFRFQGDPERWRLTVDSPEKALDRVEIYELSGRTLHQQNHPFRDTHAMVFPDLLLPPGDLLVEIRGRDQGYTLRWDREADIAEETDVDGEFSHFWNRSPNAAHRLLWKQPRTGRLPYSRVHSHYRFFVPSRHPERMRLTMKPAEDMTLEYRRRGVRGGIHGERGEELVQEEFFYPGDQFIHLRSGSGSMGRYRIFVERLPKFVLDEDAREAFEMRWQPSTTSPVLAAYWSENQKIEGVVRVENASDEAAELTLRTHSAHAGMQAFWKGEESGERDLRLSPGETREVPLVLEFDRDLRDDYPAILEIGVFRKETLVNQVIWEAEIQTGASPLSPYQRAALPEAMLGGLDLANIYLGANPLGDTHTVDREREFFRGMVRPGQGRSFDLGEPFRGQLAGAEPVPLVGFLIHPMHRSSRDSWIQAFRVESSVDGESWQIIKEGEVLPWSEEQAFPLEEEVLARYVRITGLRRQDGEAEGRFAFGSFKAVARPGFYPDHVEGVFDIAETTYGGHLVWSSPLLSRNAFLQPEPGNPQLLSLTASERMEPIQWVIGFHHNRAAALGEVGLEYRPPRRGDGSTLGRQMVIEVAAESPLGPWEEVYREDLPERVAGEKQKVRMALPEGTTGRFVRMTIPSDWQEDPETRRESILLPWKISVWEATSLHEGYRSIVGEWGHYSRRGPWEHNKAVSAGAPESFTERGAGGSRLEEAVPLSIDEWAMGSVLIGEREAHFTATVEEGENTLEIELAGEPDISFHWEITDEDGNEVKAEEASGTLPGGLLLRAEAAPGTYFLRLYEPRRNVAIAWDASGSMGPYVDILYAALPTFLQQVREDRERVQLLVFSHTPYFLLPDWSGDQNELLRTLRNYTRDDGSSDSEGNLLFMSEQMKDLEGTKAILLLTDAESPGYRSTEPMWQSFGETRPRIFTIETSSGGSRETQDLMQDWADANQGVYDFMRSSGEVEIAFARANAHLRRPKFYRVRGGGLFQEPPEPGILQTLPEEPPAGAYYFIFDASGSMMAEMDGNRKFDLAREAIASVVESLPDEAAAALRVYGHRKRAIEEGADEDTALEIRMGTLTAGHRHTFAETLARLRPMGRTPLTLSLEEAMRDLRRERREITVVLLTDGGEDTIPRRDPVPAAAAVGNTENLNLVIVGFDIHREDWAQQLQAMAEAAEAPYFPAAEAGELEPSLRRASGFSASGVRVYGTGDELLGEGVFGDSFSLPPGIYIVERGEIRRRVTVLPGKMVQVSPF
ncbi:MAG: VWA domain-containing protein [Opitutales bacterium]|nr:VWA domain-containing protein [Opitutales bacterium]MCH8541506.1 VWA domain-containing protein [Opitutales bacterium]